MTDHFDDLVIGAGMAGLTVASLLAKSGRRVLVVEAHDIEGGYAHTFTLKNFRFCAQVHYIFSCGEGESVHELLSELGVEARVPFLRLDPEGFDHVVIAGDRFRIPNGLPKFEERLVRRYPQWRAPIGRYFRTIEAIARELSLNEPAHAVGVALEPPSLPSPRSLRAVDARGLLRPRRHAAAPSRYPRRAERRLPAPAA
jgi:all-trans-retinol 13,14-reductase